MSDPRHADAPDGLSEFVSEAAPAATCADACAADTHEADAADAISISHDLQPLASAVEPAPPPKPITVVCDDGDEDWLALFEEESPEEAAPTPVSAPGAPVPFPRREPAVPGWSRSVFLRLAAASVAAFFAGAVSVLWGLHTLQSPPAVESDRTIAAVARADEPSAALPVPPLSVEPGISASALGHFNKIAAAPRSATPTLTLPAAAKGTSGVAAPRPSRPAIDAAPAPRADRAADPSTLARLVIPGGGGEELLPETLRTPIGSDAAFAPSPRNRSDAAAEEYAVRQTLHSYEVAYEGLNVAATAAVWPSVDRRALSRAFDTLKSQGLDFQSCVISVADTRATANCRGTLQFVRKVGNSLPLTAEQQWVFTMRRLGGDWKIDEVSASLITPVLAAQRIRGEE